MSHPALDHFLCRRHRTPLGIAAALLLATGTLRAAIPEPDLVWYGQVVTTSGSGPIRITTGTLVWEVEPLAGGPAVVCSTLLTNINDQFSFLIRIPCGSPEPGGTLSSNLVNLTNPGTRYRRVNVTLDGQPLSIVSAATEVAPLPKNRGQLERIDLRLGTAPADSDGDGMSDAWELQHFGNLAANPFDDADGDGMNNLREFRAGTNPTDANSLFEILEVAKVAGGVSVRWSSQPGQTYRVRRASTLLASGAEYQVIQSGIAATPPLNQFIDTSAGAARESFYLIELEN